MKKRRASRKKPSRKEKTSYQYRQQTLMLISSHPAAKKSRNQGQRTAHGHPHLSMKFKGTRHLVNHPLLLFSNKTLWWFSPKQSNRPIFSSVTYVGWT